MKSGPSSGPAPMAPLRSAVSRVAVPPTCTIVTSLSRARPILFRYRLTATSLSEPKELMPTLPPFSLSLALSAVMPLAPVMMNGLASPELAIDRKLAPRELPITTDARPTSMTSMLPPSKASRPFDPPSNEAMVKFRPLLLSKPFSLAVHNGRFSGVGVESPILTSVPAADAAAEAAGLALAAEAAADGAALVAGLLAGAEAAALGFPLGLAGAGEEAGAAAPPQAPRARPIARTRPPMRRSIGRQDTGPSPETRARRRWRTGALSRARAPGACRRSGRRRRGGPGPARTGCARRGGGTSRGRRRWRRCSRRRCRSREELGPASRGPRR